MELVADSTDAAALRFAVAASEAAVAAELFAAVAAALIELVAEPVAVAM